MDSEPPIAPTSESDHDITGNGSLWPRRTSRACASCRRDKTRCDGARPCSGCVKKGYSADKCIDGCEGCRRARQRCEGGKPCLRCQELQIECMEDADGGTTSRSESGPRLRTSTHERAKLACQGCRRDNKKCDDQRPCSRCVARGEDCVHVGRGPKLVKLRCEGCRVDNKRCEDSRPCKHCITKGMPCVNLPRKGRGHGNRVKAACTSCRRDKIRCDGARPCGACSRKGYECVDRACKICTRSGKETQCNHRKGHDTHDESPEPNETQQPVASTSIAIPQEYQQLTPDQIQQQHLQQQEMARAQQEQMQHHYPHLPSMHMQMHMPPHLEHMMPPPPFGSPIYYYPGPPHPAMMYHHNPPLDPRAYIPAIDPNINRSPVSDEREGEQQQGEQGEQGEQVAKVENQA